MLNQTPFFNDEFDMMKRSIYNAVNSSSSCSLGIVKSISTSPISVTVQNCNKYFDKIQGFQDPPLLENIPVAQLSNSAYSIKTPLNIGDVGLLLWFDREVYTFLISSSLTPTSPDSGTLNNESACVFIPIMQKFSTANELKTTGVEFVSGTVKLIEELINLTAALNTFSIAVSTLGEGIPSGTALNGGNFANPIGVLASTLATTVNQVVTKLTTFKGAQL